MFLIEKVSERDMIKHKMRITDSSVPVWIRNDCKRGLEVVKWYY